MNEAEWFQHDQLQMEHEAIEALNSVAQAGLVKEAAILAIASGLLSRWVSDTRSRSVAHIEFP
jgi:hypothetical protein